MNFKIEELDNYTELGNYVVEYYNNAIHFSNLKKPFSIKVRQLYRGELKEIHNIIRGSIHRFKQSSKKFEEYINYNLRKWIK